MVGSSAKSVDEYLAELPPDRPADVDRNRDNLPEGYLETMRWGMVTCEVPFDLYPETYDGQPLMFLALAAQKRHLALCLTDVAFIPGSEKRFNARYLETGKQLDMGRSWLRLKAANDPAIDLVAETIRSTSLDDFIEGYEVARATG